MPSIARGQTADPSNPILDLFTVQNGELIDIAVLEFEIWDVSGTPAQVFPVSGREELDPTTDAPAGDRLSLGHYAATWTPALDEPLGDHEIRWFFQLTPSSPELTFVEPFSVVEEVTAGPTNGYATIADVRAEGVPSSGYGAVSDARIIAQIEVTSRLIDRYTRRWFSPRPMTFKLDGTGRRGMLLGPPIVSISDVTILGVDDATTLPLEADDYRVYNRHLQGLLDPDDRDNPRIELVSVDERYEEDGLIESSLEIYRWPRGTQNVEISGLFGYTDPDGSATGKTPDLIKRACVLMVLRNLPVATDPDAVDARNAWRVTELRTRDQTIKWANPADVLPPGAGAFTGDPEIDGILLLYAAPPALGAA
ncbi:MAG: hypothetical protein AB7V19_07095 [Candidatus Bipolaricaulia bacterium]